MTGYQLMTQEQRNEWDCLAEKSTHGASMVFTALDGVNLKEYEALAQRLEEENRIESLMDRYGVIAIALCGNRRPVEIMRSAAGFYIGTTTDEGLPLSRESVEYWEDEDQALTALEKGAWTQREDP